MKLLVAYTKGTKNLLKIGMDDGTEKWATTTSAVVAYAKENFQVPCEAKFEMSEKNGQYHVTRVLKLGETASTSAQSASTTSDNGKPKCEDCGKELKDAKYKKCYECNKKNPVKRTSGYECPEKLGDRDAVGRSIEKQAMMKAAAQAVSTALQGQLGDADALAGMIITVYEKLLAKLNS